MEQLTCDSDLFESDVRTPNREPAVLKVNPRYEIKGSLKLKLNESGKRKIAAWLLYYAKMSVSREEIFRRAELVMQLGEKSIMLRKEETDRYSRHIPVIRLMLDTAWFSPDIADNVTAEAVR